MYVKIQVVVCHVATSRRRFSFRYISEKKKRKKKPHYIFFISSKNDERGLRPKFFPWCENSWLEFFSLVSIANRQENLHNSLVASRFGVTRLYSLNKYFELIYALMYVSCRYYSTRIISQKNKCNRIRENYNQKWFNFFSISISITIPVTSQWRKKRLPR